LNKVEQDSIFKSSRIWIRSYKVKEGLRPFPDVVFYNESKGVYEFLGIHEDDKKKKTNNHKAQLDQNGLIIKFELFNLNIGDY